MLWVGLYFLFKILYNFMAAINNSMYSLCTEIYHLTVYIDSFFLSSQKFDICFGKFYGKVIEDRVIIIVF